MEEMITVAEAADALGTTPGVLVWLHRLGVLPMHKRVGVRANLVTLDDARAALAQKRAPGKPRRAQPPADAEA